jgi:hypothetical protein
MRCWISSPISSPRFPINRPVGKTKMTEVIKMKVAESVEAGEQRKRVIKTP